MSPRQEMLRAFQVAESEEEVFALWKHFQGQLADTAAIFGFSGPSPTSIPQRFTFGKNARVESVFEGDNLLFLNSTIFSEMLVGKRSNFKTTYSISFDTNAASYLPRLFDRPDSPRSRDLCELLRHFRNRLNWQVTPYLFENYGAIAAGKNSEVIFDTIVAAEKMEDLDFEYLDRTGKVRLRCSEDDARKRAIERLSQFARHLNSGLQNNILRRWEAMYVSILAMAIEHIQKPGREFKSKKLRALIEFMDHNLNSIFWNC